LEPNPHPVYSGSVQLLAACENGWVSFGGQRTLSYFSPSQLPKPCHVKVHNFLYACSNLEENQLLLLHPTCLHNIFPRGQNKRQSSSPWAVQIGAGFPLDQVMLNKASRGGGRYSISSMFSSSLRQLQRPQLHI
jgi:hypothetical protein